jgi:hypothetical protein
MCEIVMLISTDFFGNSKLSTFICSQKNQQITFEITFVANGQLLALITPARPAMDNFQRLVQVIQWTKSTKLPYFSEVW